MALKVAELVPAATVADAGSVRYELLSESATTLPPAGAAWFNVIVQVVDEPELTLAGLQVKPDTAGATKLTLVTCEAPFRTAVIVALWFAVTTPALAVNVVELLFAATVTDAGTVSAALFDEIATALPPVGAASFKVIVQVVELPELTVAGLQASEVTTAGSMRLNVVLCRLPFRLAVIVAL